MKRFSLFSPTARLTFISGVLLALSFSSVPLPTPVESKVAEPIWLKLQQVTKLDGRYVLRFFVLNGGLEVLRYRSHGKGDYCAFLISRDGRGMERAPCCGTGLAEHALLPGEAATYQVGLGGGFGDVRIGFDFLVGGERRREVVWSDTISLP